MVYIETIGKKTGDIYCWLPTRGRGGSTGVLVPEGNEQDQSWQKDSDKAHRLCRDFYKKGNLSYLCSWTNEE